MRLLRLLPLLYTLAIIALARPRRGLAESKVYTDAVDILLVDVSTSMNALDAERDNRIRLDIATDVITQFVERQPHDRIGIVAFSGAPYTMAPSHPRPTIPFPPPLAPPHPLEPRHSPHHPRPRPALQWGFSWEESSRRGLDIMVVLDTSKSMLAEDLKPNRIERAASASKTSSASRGAPRRVKRNSVWAGRRMEFTRTWALFPGGIYLGCGLMRCFGVPFLLAFVGLLAGCSNDPYKGFEAGEGVNLYRYYVEPPRDLDPQRAYSVNEGLFLSLCYESLFQFNYWERPFMLEPQLALGIPEAQPMEGSEGVRYSIELQPGVHFIDDPCFPEGKGREMKASDWAFAFERLADPATSCPVLSSFFHISGLKEFSVRVEALRDKLLQEQGGGDPRELKVNVVDLYREAGGIPGVKVTGDYSFDIELDRPYPQILYWLAMRFVCAIPHEAVTFYHHHPDEGSSHVPMDFVKRPVGTGPYSFRWDEYHRDTRIVLEKNPNWWGYQYPERVTPATRYPAEPPTPEDEELGYWLRELAGQPLGFVDRIIWSREQEDISRFNKFVQGYYDWSYIPKDSFSMAISNDKLSERMVERGIRLEEDVSIMISYIAFNMRDEVVGSPEGLDEAGLRRNKLLRQAMSMAIDGESYIDIFYNGLGRKAEFMLPPGMTGYDPDYRNPYRAYDPKLERARALMAEAGYVNGVDPATGKALEVEFRAGRTDTQSRIRWNWYARQWGELGINVKVLATDYNEFQTQMYADNFQIFSWGWLMDYPDPENFLFLLHGANAGGTKPNRSLFAHPGFDALFKRMETMRDGETASWEEGGATVTLTREQIIERMRDIVEEECPWIPLYHQVEYLLCQEWLRGVKAHPITDAWAKYYYVDPQLRAQRRPAWNQPAVMPGVVMGVVAVLLSVVTITALRKERR